MEPPPEKPPVLRQEAEHVEEVVGQGEQEAVGVVEEEPALQEELDPRRRPPAPAGRAWPTICVCCVPAAQPTPGSPSPAAAQPHVSWAPLKEKWARPWRGAEWGVWVDGTLL